MSLIKMLEEVASIPKEPMQKRDNIIIEEPEATTIKDNESELETYIKSARGIKRLTDSDSLYAISGVKSLVEKETTGVTKIYKKVQIIPVTSDRDQTFAQEVFQNQRPVASDVKASDPPLPVSDTIKTPQ